MRVEAKLLRWGNSYGLRLRKAQVERLGLRLGFPVTIDVPDWTEPHDLSDFPTFDLGGDLSTNHDMGWDEPAEDE